MFNRTFIFARKSGVAFESKVVLDALVGLVIRPLEPRDEVLEITSLLHRAYAPLAAKNLLFTATHQSPEVTSRRLSKGFPFVAEWEGKLVGTITVYRSDPESQVPLYRKAEVWHLGQFGVEPEFKGRGIGRRLHEAAIGYAKGEQGKGMALDTAAPAEELIAMYQRWGYEIVDQMKFSSVNYESVIMQLRW